MNKNFGQRIDHVVVQEQFLNNKGPVQIINFDVAQVFGRKETRHKGEGKEEEEKPDAIVILAQAAIQTYTLPVATPAKIDQFAFYSGSKSCNH